MADTLLALLLATSSATGSSLVYRWPPTPTPSTRLSRPRPTHFELDNLSKADHTTAPPPAHKSEEDQEDYYLWNKPLRNRSHSHSSPSPVAASRSSTTDARHRLHPHSTLNVDDDEYSHALGYPAEFLAGILCPHYASCFQKFELVVDNLAFLGHPVCAEADGQWRYKRDSSSSGLHAPRGRHRATNSAATATTTDEVDVVDSLESSISSLPDSTSTPCQWLQTFHLVLVLDLPDPSSSAAGNIHRYFSIIYEQLGFILSAALFQAQVSSNYVESQCDALLALKESSLTRGESWGECNERAVEESMVARMMREVYEKVKMGEVAYVTVQGLPLELSLPPYLDSLLYADDPDADFSLNDDDDDMYPGRGRTAGTSWGPDLAWGWRLPGLAPWKSLLLLSDYSAATPGFINPSDKPLADGLLKFLSEASINLSLADMSSLLDWDLETQVYPAVRWLVLHRRAKVVDLVHPGLKTVFTLPQTFPRSLDALSKEYADHFVHHQTRLPVLRDLLSMISSAGQSSAGVTPMHFFASVVKEKDLVPLYQEVVEWLLERDMLVTMHLRVRIVATKELKARVRMAILAGARRRRRRSVDEEFGDEYDEEFENEEEGEEDEDLIRPDTSTTSHLLSSEDLTSSIIDDPGRATPLQRLWLEAMSHGKDPRVARRFEQMNQYFDGKRTDGEILYWADVQRRQLREVLCAYEEYVMMFLHP